MLACRARSRLNKMGTLEGQPDQDAVALALADSKSRLNKMGNHRDQPDQAVVVLGLADPKSRLNKMGTLEDQLDRRPTRESHSVKQVVD